MQIKKIFRRKKKQQKLQHKILKLIIWLLAIFIIIASILLFTKHGEVQRIFISKNLEIENSQKLKNVLLSLKGKKIILLNDKQIYQFLNKQIPNLKNLEVKKVFPNRLYILFETYPLVFKTPDNLFIDQTGTLIAGNQEQLESEKTPLIILTPSNNLQAFDQALNQEQVANLLDTLNYFKKTLNLDIRSLEYKIVPKELHLKTPIGTTIWIDTTYDYKQQINKLKNAIPKIDLYKTFYQHIDLRIQSKNAQKIFYKQ